MRISSLASLNNNYLRNSDDLTCLHDLYYKISEYLLERLDYTNITPQYILVLESRFDIDYKLIRNKYPQANIYQVNTIGGYLGMVQKDGIFAKIFSTNSKQYKLNCRLDNVPIKSQFFDLVVAPLALNFYPNYVDVIKEIRRLLKKNGAFFLSGLGVDSFKELRDYGLSVGKFPDMHDIGDELVRLNFSNPVLDRETLNLTYSSLNDALNEIRLCGNGGLNKPTYLSKDTYKKISQNPQAQNITLELYSAHAWRDNLGFELDDGVKVIQFK